MRVTENVSSSMKTLRFVYKMIAVHLNGTILWYTSIAIIATTVIRTNTSYLFGVM